MIYIKDNNSSLWPFADVLITKTQSLFKSDFVRKLRNTKTKITDREVLIEYYTVTYKNNKI